MSISQLILSTIFLFFIYKTCVSYWRKKISKIFTILWLAFWVTGIFAVLDLNLLEKTANFIGIGRGADLVLYLSIILIFYLIFVLFVKIDEVNKTLTRIVRREALRNSKGSKA
jgi:hypothetical protein